MHHTSNNNNKSVVVVVDRATGFFFASPMPSKAALDVARVLLNLYFAFGAPVATRIDAARELTAQAVRHLC